MKYFAYIYIKDKVLRTALNPNIGALANYIKEYPKGEIFEIQTDSEDSDEWILEKPIQEMFTLIKIVYRHYFFLRRYYEDILNDEILYRALQEVRKEYDERATQLN